jgi:hypothetical protein
MAAANTLAYYDIATITAVKSFTVEAPLASTITFLQLVTSQVVSPTRWRYQAHV